MMTRQTGKVFCIAILLMFAVGGEREADAAAAGSDNWITSWAATPAPRWGSEVPAPFTVPETMEGVTIRQVARLSIGGGKVRVVLSNEYGSTPLIIGAGSVALAGAKGALGGRRRG